MSRINECASYLDEIIKSGDELVASYKKTAKSADAILKALKAIRGLITDETLEEKPKEQAAVETAELAVEAPKEEAKPVTFEEVRGLMAALSGKGMKAEARELLQKYGAKRLSEVEEKDYAALAAETKAVANG